MLARSNSDRSPLYDVRNHARRSLVRDTNANSVSRGRCGYGFQPTLQAGWLAEPKLATTSPPLPVGLRRDSPARSASEGWWSQTGSNRRPHACKARALPAELWPRKPEDECFTSVIDPSLFQGETHPIKWWAWEDLNFRPHAYQARALTN